MRAGSTSTSIAATRELNLMTEWHQRSGGPGVMVYWHVERHSRDTPDRQIQQNSNPSTAEMVVTNVL
jgi:TnpA family transposase